MHNFTRHMWQDCDYIRDYPLCLQRYTCQGWFHHRMAAHVLAGPETTYMWTWSSTRTNLRNGHYSYFTLLARSEGFSFELVAEKPPR